MFYLESLPKQISDIKRRSVSALSALGADYESMLESLEETEEKPTSLVLVGFYNAGKSTIAQMLTRDTSIKIASTQSTDKVTSYPWNDVMIVDTPGIDTGTRPDHDELTYSAIASSDMLS